jgi:integrase
MHGKQPYWPETLLKCYVQPAAERVGITKQIGWHSFRRTFATLLKGGGEDVKTVQELMRHANSRLTLDVYAQALTPAKRAAHLKVVEMIRPTMGNSLVPLCSHAEKTASISR